MEWSNFSLGLNWYNDSDSDFVQNQSDADLKVIVVFAPWIDQGFGYLQPSDVEHELKSNPNQRTFAQLDTYPCVNIVEYGQ